MGGQLNGLEQFELQILSLTNNNTCGTLPTTRCRRDVEWAAIGVPTDKVRPRYLPSGCLDSSIRFHGNRKVCFALKTSQRAVAS